MNKEVKNRIYKYRSSDDDGYVGCYIIYGFLEKRTVDNFNGPIFVFVPIAYQEVSWILGQERVGSMFYIQDKEILNRVRALGDIDLQRAKMSERKNIRKVVLIAMSHIYEDVLTFKKIEKVLGIKGKEEYDGTRI